MTIEGEGATTTAVGALGNLGRWTPPGESSEVNIFFHLLGAGIQVLEHSAAAEKGTSKLSVAGMAPPALWSLVWLTRPHIQAQVQGQVGCLSRTKCHIASSTRSHA